MATKVTQVILSLIISTRPMMLTAEEKFNTILAKQNVKPRIGVTNSIKTLILGTINNHTHKETHLTNWNSST